MKKSKAITRLIQVSVLVLLFVTVLLQIQSVGTASSISEELIYWERARLLVGQGGLSQYDGSSLASLGYSLLLVPICLLINSPYAAYKAAVLLCGFFYCVSYIISVMAAKKMFPKENERFLSIACFFVVVCPVFTFAKCFTGPEWIILFLMWLILYLLVSLWNEYKKEKLVALAACLALMGFFQISSIGAILAAVILLGIFVKHKKLDENSYLTFILCLLICFAIGNFAERGILSGLYQEYEVEVSSSFEVLMDGISAGWKKDSFAGFLNSLIGKLFVSAVGSFLIVCAGYWFIIKESFIQIKKKTLSDNYMMSCIVFLPFVIQLIIWAVYSNSLAVAEGLTSISNMEVFLLPVILLGIVQIKNSVHWEKELTGYVLFMCISAFVTANLYQKNGVGSIFKVNSSIMLILHNGTRKPVAIVYMAACIAILAGIVLFGCLKSNFNKQSINKVLKGIGATGALVVCVLLNVFMLKSTAVYSNDYTMQYAAPVASLLSEIRTEAEYYYVYGGSNDGNAVNIQSLVPEKKINTINNNRESRVEFFEAADKETDEIVLITGTNKSFIDTTLGDYLDEYRLLYTTAKHAVWAYRGSDICQELDQAVCSRVESLALTDIEVEEPEEIQTDELSTETVTELETREELSSEEAEESEIVVETEGITETEFQTETETSKETESDTENQTVKTESENKSGYSATHTYGGDVILAPGTYRLEVYFQRNETAADLEGTLSVLSDGEKISSKKISSDIFDENGKGAVVIEFTSRAMMINFKVTIKGTIAAEAEVTDIYYWKQNSAYTVGLNGGITKNACDTILNLDELCGTVGTVAYVADIMTEKSDISVRCFEDRMPGYEVAVVSKEELRSLDTDYLIGVTSSHPYFGAMDRYSIIRRNAYYTVLVRNDSAQYRKYLEEEGRLLSEGEEIKLTAFLGKDISLTTPFALEAGSYNYRLRLLYNPEELSGVSSDVIGTICIFDGEDILLEKAHTKADLVGDGSGKTEIIVPFTLRDKADELLCTFVPEGDVMVEIIPQGIELAAEKYQFGQEENLKEFYDLVNDLGNTRCAVVLTDKEVDKAQISYEFLQQKMPKCEMTILTYEQANNYNGDTFLITYGFSKSYMQLLGNYSIIGHAGRYTLWAKSNGELLLRSIASGAQILSNGKKISPESVVAASGEKEAIINLPKATYNVTMKVDADQIDNEDTIVARLLRDKTEKEIREEIDELIDAGYSTREAESAIEIQVICGDASYKPYQFDETSSILIVLRTNGQKIINLMADVYSWHGCEIEVEMLWIELV